MLARLVLALVERGLRKACAEVTIQALWVELADRARCDDGRSRGLVLLSDGWRLICSSAL